jgi:hypothetical protein
VVRVRRIGALLLALGAGVIVGLSGAFVQAHRAVWLIEGRYIVVPWGAAVVVVVLLMLIRTAGNLTRRRSAAWLLLAGWLAATFFLATESSSGDLAVSSGPRQWGYLLVGVVFGSALATLPPRHLESARGNQTATTDV